MHILQRPMWYDRRGVELLKVGSMGGAQAIEGLCWKLQDSSPFLFFPFCFLVLGEWFGSTVQFRQHVLPHDGPKVIGILCLRIEFPNLW